MEKIFMKNDINETVKAIREKIATQSYIVILFPHYHPIFGAEYDIIGKTENHEKIADILRCEGIDSKKIAIDNYAFFSSSLSLEEKEAIEKEAIQMAYLFDLL